MKFADLTRWRGRYLPFAGAGLCAALTVVVYLVGISPLIGRQEDVASHRKKLDSLRKRDRELSARLTALKEKVSSTRQELVETPLKLQSSLYANKRLARLGDIASASGVNLGETEFEMPFSGSEYQMIPIRLVGKASYRACAMFLHKLRQEFSDMALWSMELSRTAGNPSEQVTFHMRIIWFTAIEFLSAAETGSAQANRQTRSLNLMVRHEID